MGRLFGNIRLPGFLQGQADKLGTSQVLGSRWKWLADIRAPLDAIDPRLVTATPEAYAQLVETLTDSPLTVAQLRVLSAAARDAMATKEQSS